MEDRRHRERPAIAAVVRGPHAHLARIRLARLTRRLSWGDLAVLVLLGGITYGLVRLGHEWRAPVVAALEIDLSLAALPLYTFFSLCRGLAAFALSLAFTLAYGYTAARVRYADRVLLPLLDVLQSIPVLGFMPGVVLALASLFPSSNTGLELAAILMIFTGQVWNMTFSFYHSLRSIPLDLVEAAHVYRFSLRQRVLLLELPFSAGGLVWNGMMSMAGGWFFLTINESFRLGTRDFRLPGVGAYMSVAIDRDDHLAMGGAVVAMIILIVGLDQLVWRPLVAWSERFKVEEVGSSDVARSWALDLFKTTALYASLKAAIRRSARRPRRSGASATIARAPRARPRVPAWLGPLLVVGPLVVALVWGSARLAGLLAGLEWSAWVELVSAAGLTFVRTSIAVVLGSLWAVPAGIYIGTHPRASRVLQPFVQVAAAFPAPMLFPLVLFVLHRLGVSLGVGSVLLMMLGTQWYVMFNVIAGAMALPHQLQEAAEVYRFTRWQRWTKLLLPGVFPHLVTGWVTAAGGAWNASIVSEYVHAGPEVETTRGLGALISVAAERGDLRTLAAGVLTMAIVVVAINRTFWRKLYQLAERRYAVA